MADNERNYVENVKDEFEKDEKYRWISGTGESSLLVPYSDDFNGKNWLLSVLKSRSLNVCPYLSWSWFGPTPFCATPFCDAKKHWGLGSGCAVDVDNCAL